MSNTGGAGPSTPAGAGTSAGAASEELSLSSGRGRWVLAAMVLGSGIALLDSTVVSIALPSIGREFHGGVDTLQWVVTGYSLTLAAFLLLGGSLGDRYGRKRIFSIGVVWFAVAYRPPFARVATDHLPVRELDLNIPDDMRTPPRIHAPAASAGAHPIRLDGCANLFGPVESIGYSLELIRPSCDGRGEHGTRL